MKKAVLAKILMLLLIVVVVASSNTRSPRAENRIWVVDDDGLADFSSIQDAINAASDNDTILVRSGIYHEGIHVYNKRLSLVGEDWRTTIIDGTGKWAVAELLGPANMTGFTICNGEMHGIYAPDHNYPLTEPQYVMLIVGNAFINNPVGLWANYSRFLFIYHNNFMNNTADYCCEETQYNTYDDGHLGNYWDSYTGVDDGSGIGRFGEPRVAGDGVGDTDVPFAPPGSARIDWYPLMEPWTSSPKHDITVDKIVLSKNVVGQGYNLNINATVSNKGFFMENFNFTVYANTTLIATQTITLTIGDTMAIIFAWNTSGWMKGKYTISAYAWPVPGEIDTTDNTYTNGIVTVTIPGDVDGDFDVDILDVVKITSIYASKKGDHQFNPNSDIDSDGVITILDVVIACTHYGQKDP